MLQPTTPGISVYDDQLVPPGCVLPTISSGNPVPAKCDGTKSGTPPDSGLSADLLFVVSHWQGLPAAIRSAIAAIVRADVEAHSP